MVRVIDPPAVPKTVDYDVLYRAKNWTGLALRSERRRPWLTLVLASVALALTVFLAVGVRSGFDVTRARREC